MEDQQRSFESDLIPVPAPPGSQVLEDINAVLHYEGLVRNRHRLMLADVETYSDGQRTDALLYALHFPATCARAMSTVHIKTDLDAFDPDQQHEG